MALTHKRISINDVTPTLVTINNVESNVNCTLLVQNLGEEAVYLGSKNLSLTDYGLSIVPGATVTMDNLAPSEEVYVLSASGNSYVSVLRLNR